MSLSCLFISLFPKLWSSQYFPWKDSVQMKVKSCLRLENFHHCTPLSHLYGGRLYHISMMDASITSLWWRLVKPEIYFFKSPNNINTTWLSVIYVAGFVDMLGNVSGLFCWLIDLSVSGLIIIIIIIIIM